ncbi:MAG: nitrous oxide reductase accessory protein NosL [Rhodothermales bacterium]|nr:nitrous oxide reductase accessory protein NosL [Rhodothermales bacterium]
MTKRARITLALASLLLLVMYAAPLWNITLEAPQYPEGLGLKIMLTDVQGQKPHDLSNINNLNHYIGMKRIEPDAIPELRIMPWIVAFLIVSGLAVAAVGKRSLLYTWCGVFLLVALAGLADFWLWAYDYGHNLDTEHAAIKVPGMTYQPPIIGSKKLLNFTAHSWPALGGWAAFISLGVGMSLAWQSWRSERTTRVAGRLGGAVAAGFALLVTGCGQPGPEPFVFGQDTDAFCRMTISEPVFASQLVTSTGKVYKFDSVECMVGYVHAGRADDVAQLWVTDSARPGQLIPAEEAFFVQSSAIRSPMGGGLMAVSDEVAALALATERDGSVLSWGELTPAVAEHIH